LAEEIISTGVPEDVGTESEADPVEGAQEPELRDCVVPASMHGWRIDKTLATLVPEFSRSYLQQLMADGAVLIRGAVAGKPAARVLAGDRLRVELRPTLQAMAFVAQAMALDIAYEDDDLMVVRKPAGLVVHPAAGNWSGTLLNGLLAHHAAAASLPRAGIVHRLDKDTSGLMLVGKSRRAVDALVRAIAAREVQREYLALGHKEWKRESPLDVAQAVGRDPAQRLRMAVLREDHPGAKSARTTVRLLDTNEQACLVACKLHTGRTHQIRVHMAWLGHSLVGDSLYGGRPLWGLQRQALHATRLQLAHPVSGAALAFACEPPVDIQRAVEQAGLHYNGYQPG
jgi:23S rRNA pseudouridine1911/1915/1917 synthase